jgi:hypothetical protein
VVIETAALRATGDEPPKGMARRDPARPVTALTRCVIRDIMKYTEGRA